MKGPGSAEEDAPVDGRVRRGARNREAIVAALFELIGEGGLRPTAEQVAERAGVGTRTVFRHFDDMESLYAELAGLMRREISPVLDLDMDGSLTERATALIQHRTALFERIAPYKRSGNLHRYGSKFLQQQAAEMVREQRASLIRSLPELENAPAPLVDALDLVTSFDSWDRLRSEQRLGRDRARESIEAAALAILSRLDS